MSGEKSQLTPLAARKQLLLVESELNRAQLLNELRDFNNQFHHLKNQIQAAGCLVSSAAKLATTITAIRHGFTHREPVENGKSSWLSAILKGARTGALIWEELRSHLK